MSWPFGGNVKILKEPHISYQHASSAYISLSTDGISLKKTVCANLEGFLPRVYKLMTLEF